MSYQTIAERLRGVYNEIESLRRHVEQSDVWRRIQTHIVNNGRNNVLVYIPDGFKLYVRGGSNGLHLAKVSPYAKDIKSVNPPVLVEPAVFRAEVRVNMIGKDDDNLDYPPEYEKTREIQIPFSLLENYDEAEFQAWIEVKRSEAARQTFKRLHGEVSDAIKLYPVLKQELLDYLMGD